MAYALFREAVRNDMEIKFGSAEGLQKAIERQRDKAIKDQLVEVSRSTLEENETTRQNTCVCVKSLGVYLSMWNVNEDI